MFRQCFHSLLLNIRTGKVGSWGGDAACIPVREKKSFHIGQKLIRYSQAKSTLNTSNFCKCWYFTFVFISCLVFLRAWSRGGAHDNFWSPCNAITGQFTGIVFNTGEWCHLKGIHHELCEFQCMTRLFA